MRAFNAVTHLFEQPRQPTHSGVAPRFRDIRQIGIAR